MAKKTTKPNIPQATLDRARQQAEKATASTPLSASSQADAQADAERAARRAERRARAAVGRGTLRTNMTSGKVEAPRQAKGGSKYDQDSITQLLANPIKFVSEEELRAEYSYVLSDLRNMFVLAVGLMVFLMILAQVM